MTTTTDIVAKLWALCHVLRDDGVTYNEYVTELTFLLFLKMLEETKREERLPEAYRWGELAKREGLDQLDYYKRLLLDLGKPDTKDGLVRAIFTDAQTRLRKPTNLKALTSNIDQLDWFSAREEGLGNLYEGLLEKNAADKKSGAGQYFTPRPLIDCIVRLMKPQPGEIVQDPAAGTAGFLVAADRYIKDQTDDLFKLTEQQGFFQRHNAFVGAELVPDTHRLCMMNLLLHGIEGGVELADTLSPDGERAAEGRSRPDQSAVRHQEGRRAADALRLLGHGRHVEQAAGLRRAYRPRAEAGRAGRDGGARQRAVRGQHRAAAAHMADGPVQPAHHPAAADRHLLCAGRQDQRAVLPARQDRQGEHQGGLGLRHAGEHARLRQDPPADGR